MKTTKGAAGPVAGILLGALVLLGVAFGQDDDVLALGKEVFEVTAGAVGCAFCHGLDGRGEGLAGLEAPDIRAAQMPAIRSAITGGVPAMSFIKLTEPEFLAVSAYVAQLGAPEPADQEAPPAEPDPLAQAEAPTVEAPRFLTINIEITEEGFRPADIEFPVGQMIRLVVRDRTLAEHHYRIVGLVPRNLLWLAEPDPGEPAAGVTEDEHEAHHASEYVAWRSASPFGIQPTGNEVHAWTYVYSPGGGRDVVLFAATNTGTFRVEDPLHPEFTGTVTVTESTP